MFTQHKIIIIVTVIHYFEKTRLLVILFHFTEPFYANAIVSIIIADTCLCQLQRKVVEDDVIGADKYL